MKLIRLVGAIAVAAAIGVATDRVDAATKRFFDPNTNTYIEYGVPAPRKAQRRARLRIEQQPARRQVRQAAQRTPPKLRFRPFDETLAAPPRQTLARAPSARPAVLPEKLRPMPGPEFDRQIVQYETTEKPGTIVIDTGSKFLYYVLEGGEAIRYGVGVGKEGFGWTGVVEVGARQEWPKWFPPAEMVKRRPELAKYQGTGMEGGEDNPLGARALYLYDNGKDTLFRIHGTNEPWSIGLNVSSGCIRMLNENVIELYSMAKIGAKVIVT